MITPKQLAYSHWCPEVQAAWDEHIRLYQEAEQLHEISDDLDTPEGEKAYDAYLDADAAYERYEGLWRAAEGYQADTADGPGTRIPEAGSGIESEAEAE